MKRGYDNHQHNYRDTFHNISRGNGDGHPSAMIPESHKVTYNGSHGDTNHEHLVPKVQNAIPDPTWGGISRRRDYTDYSYGDFWGL